MTKETIFTEIQLSYKPANGLRPSVLCAQDAYEILKHHYPDETIQLQEQFVVLYLNRANKLIGVHKLSSGGMTSTIADIRIILSVALKSLATAIIISHNHPTGNLKPSSADIRLTDKIKEGAKFLDIELVDHLILSESGYFSFSNDGILV